MSGSPSPRIGGVDLDIGSEAVIATAPAPLTVLSSAVVGGGLVRASTIMNVRVPHDHPCDDPAGILAAYARRRGIAEPYVGLLTAAPLERARVAVAAQDGLEAMAVVTVGLANRCAAGLKEPVAALTVGTINTIVIVDGAATPAALVNAALTVTEAKALVLFEHEVRTPEGVPATGTSTDAVVIAVTGAGPLHLYGGPASDFGSLVGKVVRDAIRQGVREWLRYR